MKYRVIMRRTIVQVFTKTVEADHPDDAKEDARYAIDNEGAFPMQSHTVSADIHVEEVK
jgi:hypothetical protein